MCVVLSVSPSGYRAWKRGGAPNRQHLTDTQLLVLIRTIHAELKGAYGSPRMLVELRPRGRSSTPIGAASTPAEPSRTNTPDTA